MKIDRIKLKNLNSLQQEVDIDFNVPPLAQTGLFAIVGDTGAGKTTILDALTLGLYGKIHRNRNTDEVMSYGTAECYAEIIFSVPEGQFMAKWSLRRAYNKPEGNIQAPYREFSRLSPDEKIITSDKRYIDQKIEEKTGLDYDRFCRSVLLSQGDFAAFLKAKPGERSDLLERITGTEYYSRLSKAAFQRAKNEREVLQRLDQQKSMLAILDEEEENGLKENLAAGKKELKTLQTQLEELRGQLSWLDQMEAVMAEEQRLTTRLQELEEQSVVVDEKRKRMDRHRKAQPLQPLLTELKLKKDLQKGLIRQTTELSERLASSRTKQQTEETALQTLSEQVEKLAADEEREMKRFDQVREKDLAIQNARQSLEQDETRLRSLQKEQTERDARLKSLDKDISSLEKRIGESTAWREEHATDARINDIMPDVEALSQVLGRLRGRSDELAKRRTRQDKELEKLEKTLQQARTAEEKAQADLRSLRDKLDECWPDIRESEPDQLLEMERKRLEKLQDQLQWLEKARELEAAQQQFHREFDQRDEELRHLLNEENHLQARLLARQDALDEAMEEVEFHRKVHLQQIAIAGMEEHRQHLKDGEPCPLCLATEHPFRRNEEALTPMVGKAEQALQRADAQVEKIRSEVRSLLSAERNLSDRIRHLAGDQERGMDGQMDLLRRRIGETETLLAELLQRLREADWSPETDPQALQAQIDRVSQDQEALQVAIRNWQQAGETVRETMDRRKETEWQYNSLQSKREETKEEADKVRRDISSDQEKLQQHLQAFSLSKQAVPEAVSQLRERAQAWHQREDTHQQLVSDLRTANASREEQFSQSKKVRAERTALEEACEQARSQLQDLEAERRRMFGDKDPQAAKEAWSRVYREMQEKRNTKREGLVRLREELRQLEERRKDLTEDSKKNEKGISDLEQTLEDRAAEAGFTEVNSLQTALLSEDAAEHLEAAIRTHDESLRDCQNRLTDSREKRAELQKNRKTDASRAEIEPALREAEEQQAAAQQEQGRLRNRLEENAARKETQQKLIQRIDEQRGEYRRWERLNILIGSADGKKFRVFAQGLTLEKLVQLANRHLQDLNGRYLIRKQEGADLELAIIDTFQANHQRSMNTLSGGESFLVSLALALGLSDLAGRKTRIRSLFIDEGFGTLDEATLDLALSTLENLQASGKTIGIISHVRELKERISTQLVVKKGSDGFSQVRLEG